jgi:hypothetical protein
MNSPSLLVSRRLYQSLTLLSRILPKARGLFHSGNAGGSNHLAITMRVGLALG